MLRIRASLLAKYDRYLKDVNWRQCRATLGAFYAFVAYVLHSLDVPARLTLEASCALTFAALIVYLIIPKPKQALLDNLAQNAASDPALADRIIAVGKELAGKGDTANAASTTPA